jgi:hypothetical protein
VVYGSLDNPIAKLGRAAEHFRGIRDLIGGFDHQAIPLRVDRHQDGLQYDLYADHVDPLPRDLPLMLGDAYHNLRGALDHLTYQLHERRYRGKIPTAAALDSQFPIINKPRTDKKGNPISPDKWNGIKYLSDKERKAIAWLQPYVARKDKLQGVRAGLRDIGDIDNIDKHRKLHVTRTVPQALPSMSSIPDYGLKQNPSFGIPIETGTLVDVWTFERPPPVPPIASGRTFRAAVGIELNGDRTDALPHLGGSILIVDEIIRRFASLFPPPPEPLDLSWVRQKEPPPWG